VSICHCIYTRSNQGFNHFEQELFQSYLVFRDENTKVTPSPNPSLSPLLIFRPPSEDELDAATDVFFEFCIKPEVIPDVQLEGDDAGIIPCLNTTVPPEVDGGEMERVEEGDEDVLGFDSGAPQIVVDGIHDVQPGGNAGDSGDSRGQGKEIGIEGLVAAAKRMEDVEWGNDAADRFIEKHAAHDDADTLTLGEFVDAFENFRMRIRMVSLKLLVDDMLEQQGAREMARASDMLKQQLFAHSHAAAARADKCYALKSTAVPDRTKRGGGMTSRTQVLAFQQSIPEMEEKAFHRTNFVEALKKGTSALSDVADMSTSFFKRPWAAKRLATASEALKNAKLQLDQSCPPPTLGVTQIKMLVERRARTATGSTDIGIFGSRATTRGSPQFGARLGTTNLLTLPEDGESRLGTGELQLHTSASALLTDRTRTEVEDLLAEGKVLMDNLAEDASQDLANAIQRGGSPVAEMMRRHHPQSPRFVASFDDANVNGLDDLTHQGAQLSRMLPDGIAQEVVATVLRSDSPVASAIKRSNSPIAEILRLDTPQTAGSMDAPGTPGYAAPDYAGPAHAAHLPGEDAPHESKRDKELDMKILSELLVMCGLSKFEDSHLMEVVAKVQALLTKELEGVCWSSRHAPMTGTNSHDTNHGPEAFLLPMVYDELHSTCWVREAHQDMARALQREKELSAQLSWYQKAKDAYEEAIEDFSDGAFTDSKTKVMEADQWFARSTTIGLKWKQVTLEQARSGLGPEITNNGLSEALRKKVEFSREEWDGFKVASVTAASYIAVDHSFFKPSGTGHDHQLLCRELKTRAHGANILTLKDLAYESVRKSVELTDALDFDAARSAVEEAVSACLQIDEEERVAGTFDSAKSQASFSLR